MRRLPVARAIQCTAQHNAAVERARPFGEVQQRRSRVGVSDNATVGGRPCRCRFRRSFWSWCWCWCWCFTVCAMVRWCAGEELTARGSQRHSTGVRVRHERCDRGGGTLNLDYRRGVGRRAGWRSGSPWSQDASRGADREGDGRVNCKKRRGMEKASKVMPAAL